MLNICGTRMASTAAVLGCLVVLCLLPARPLAQDMTLLLKQAADSLLVNSLPGLAVKTASAAQLPSRLGQPGPADLTIRRLQVSLALLVEDNWKDLTEPPRWAILQSQGRLQHIDHPPPPPVQMSILFSSK